jgi:hypothetical protein
LIGEDFVGRPRQLAHQALDERRAQPLDAPGG